MHHPPAQRRCTAICADGRRTWGNLAALPAHILTPGRSVVRADRQCSPVCTVVFPRAACLCSCSSLRSVLSSRALLGASFLRLSLCFSWRHECWGHLRPRKRTLLRWPHRRSTHTEPRLQSAPLLALAPSDLGAFLEDGAGVGAAWASVLPGNGSTPTRLVSKPVPEWA